jgi:hypothetical protein
LRDQIDDILPDESPDPLLPDLSILMGEDVPLAVERLLCL